MKNDSVIPALTKSLGGMNHVPSSCNLEINPSTTFEEWQSLGMTLRSLEYMVKWWIADWLVFGDGKFGEMASQVMNDLGYDYQTLANFKWVAGRIPVSRRRENLSFGHHVVVARFEPREQDHWLDKAEDGNWTRDELRRALADEGVSQAIRDVRISALGLKIESNRVILAVEHNGVWRNVLVEENLPGGKMKTLQAAAIAKSFE